MTQANTSIDIHDYAVIIAGGAGTRLWPVSRKSKPKQFQRLIGNETLLQHMYAQVSGSFPPERIFIQTSAEYAHFISEQLPQVPDENLILEPEARDTAPALAFATVAVVARDPEANVGIFYSDHLIEAGKDFGESVSSAFEAVKKYPANIVMIGVTPLFPHTGLGYIHIDGASPDADNSHLFTVKGFVEKPDLARATTFVGSPDYLWNTGYKVVKGKNHLALFSSVSDVFAKTLPLLVDAYAKGRHGEVALLFKELPRQSYEYLVTEKSDALYVVASHMKWSDVGDWETVHTLLAKNKGSDVQTDGKVVEEDCKNTLIISNHRNVVAVGVENLIVIETEDAVLIMSKNRSQDIKSIINKLIDKEPKLA